jgi:nitroreductase
MSPSAANKQPLKFVLSNQREKNSLIFSCTAWAGYLKDWKGPAECERPSAYILILCDTSISESAEIDCGIAAQSIMLGAVEMGLGGCMLGALLRENLAKLLKIPPKYRILLAIALGTPDEKVVVEDSERGGDIKYWREAGGTHHVPKRKLEELILDF